MRTYIFLMFFSMCFILSSQNRLAIEDYIFISDVNTEVNFNTYTIYSSVLAEYDAVSSVAMSSEIYLMLQSTAEQANLKALYTALANMSFDGQRTVYDVVEGNIVLEEIYFSIIENVRLVSISYPTRNSVEVVMALDLTDENAGDNIIDIFIENIPPVDPYPTMTYFNSGKDYDSLVIDARGIGFNPSIFPTVSDEDGNIIHNISFVSRDRNTTNSNSSFVTYTTNARTLDKDFESIAINPYHIVAWNVRGTTRGDIVIYNEDANVITSNEILKKSLREGKVIIIID